jgi:hypothetical protein
MKDHGLLLLAVVVVGLVHQILCHCNRRSDHVNCRHTSRVLTLRFAISYVPPLPAAEDRSNGGLVEVEIGEPTNETG